MMTTMSIRDLTRSGDTLFQYDYVEIEKKLDELDKFVGLLNGKIGDVKIGDIKKKYGI